MSIARTLAVLVLALPLSLQAETLTLQPAPGQRATEARTVALASGCQLSVKNINGRIRVTGWDREEVQFTGEFIPGSDASQVKVILESGKGSLEIRADHPKGERRKGPVCEMDLKVPHRVAATLANVNGAVELSEVQGETRCSTVNGGIKLAQVSGPLLLKTVNGGIDGRGLTGAIQAKTVNGGITLDGQGLKGQLKASTLNGALSCTAAGASEAKVSKRKLEATLQGGGERIELKTLNGAISVR
jgi:DUF4097 and DUF4098 domain-containing protein YvlB